MVDESSASAAFWEWIAAAPPEFLFGAVFGAGLYASATTFARLKRNAKKIRDRRDDYERRRAARAIRH